MQQKNERRTNRERAETTRALLISAARKLFVEKSYSATATPEIVEAAGVTRGAMYHHFEDKQALFRAVVEQEAAAVATEIETASNQYPSAMEALVTGTKAYLHSMSVPGRTRLMLLDGPAVLGRETMDSIDDRNGNRTLREGLDQAMGAGEIKKLPLQALTSILGAAFDRAALAIGQGANEADQMTVLVALFEGLKMKAV